MPQNSPVATENKNDSLKLIPPPYQPTKTKYFELRHTSIDIAFDIPERTANGKVQLQMSPYFYATDSVVLDAVGMRILNVQDEKFRDLDYHYDGEFLVVKLPKKFNKNEKVVLNIKYVARPYTVPEKASLAIRRDKGLYFINHKGDDPLKPVQLWTQGETESNSKWFPTFDDPQYKSTFDITMHVPDSFTTLSNGLLKKSVKEGNGMRADTWVQDQPMAPYLAMMAVGDFAVHREKWQGKEVSYYVPQRFKTTAQQIFAHTPEMLTFFSNKLGLAYPWDKYSQVGVYDFVSGAMENTTASVFGAFNLKNERELADAPNDFIVAHELFHHWFGNYVTAENWGQLTINESFADYSEYLWSEYKYGKNAAELVWQRGWERYLGQAEKYDPSLVRYHYHSPGVMFDRVSYNKGGRILNYLRRLMGDEAFFAGLNEFLKAQAFGTAESDNLRMAFEKVSGKDWRWFFNEWYHRAGHPILDISYRYLEDKNQLEVTVKQIQKDSVGLYQMPLRAQLLTDKGIQDFEWNLEAKREQTFLYDYPNQLRPIFIPDAEHWLPGEIIDGKTVTDAAKQLVQSKSYITKKWALKQFSARKDPSDDERKLMDQALLKALTDADEHNRELIVRAVDLSKKKHSAELENAVALLAKNDPAYKVQFAALQVLSNVASLKYLNLFEEKSSSFSYNVAGAGIAGLLAQQPKRAYDVAKKLQDQELRGFLLSMVASVFAKEAQPEDYPFFTTHILKEFEGVRKGLVSQFVNFLAKVEDLSLFSSGIAWLNDVAAFNDGAFREQYLKEFKELSERLSKQVKINSNLYKSKEKLDLLDPYLK